MKFEFTVGVGRYTQSDEFTLEQLGLEEDEWNTMSEQERNDFLDERWSEWIVNYLSGGVKEIEE